MKSECPYCKSGGIKNVISHSKGDDNIDNIGHFHLECQVCGANFNLWECDEERIIKLLGKSYK